MQPGALVAGKYRIVQKLGEGGMGSVWLAKNEVTERDFAIKFLTRDSEATPAQLTRFFQEAKIAGRLRHPSVVEIFDAGTEPTLDDAPYIVMELLDGVGLDEAIQRAGGLPLGFSLEIIDEVARALALAHEKGIIHRDLKPSNVHLHRTGNGSIVAKVLDFGISKVLQVEEATGRHITGMTRTGALLGSPLYMSPEQAAGDKSIDARSDVHALGVMLWQCLAGRPPFNADTYGLLLVEIIQGERPHLCKVLPSVPPAVSDLVARAIARERDQRFANAGAFADALEREMSELGHVPVLSKRCGAEQLFAVLGSPTTERAEKATSTTAAVSLPSGLKDSEPTTGVVEARSDSVARPNVLPVVTQPAPAFHTPLDRPIEHLPQPPRRSRLPVIIGGATIGLVAAVVAAFFFSTPNADPSASPEPRATDPNTATLPTSPAAPAPAGTPVIMPTVEAPAPHESAAPSASSAPRPVAKGAPAKPAPAKPAPAGAPKPSGSPVHHGVTNSGL